MIDRFSREQFEAALPAGLWSSIGCVDGEFQYRMEVNSAVFIVIRSSVRPDGYAAETGADSIRCWLVNAAGQPLAKKVQAYVTRVPGWQNRMLEVLRGLWRKAKTFHYCCGEVMRQNVVKKDGPNKGREFRTCDRCGAFEWVEVAK